MKFFLALYVISQSAFAIDVGNGSDGNCNVTGGTTTKITSAKKYYQCENLNIDANLYDFQGSQAGAGGEALLIKVQGNVTIAAGVTVDLSGEGGFAGDAIFGIKTGGRGGAGGFSGGSTLGPNLDGVNGSGTGGGFKGRQVDHQLMYSYGGGGGGGSYKNQGVILATDGDDIGNTGSKPGTGGEQGVIYGDEAIFESSFTGGSGGAGGGGGQESTQPDFSGSSGGGGGGAIHIVAGGNITIDGSIISNGGGGGGIGSKSGGGGGGSGGAIWLQAGKNIVVSNSGSITSSGGAKGLSVGAFGGGEGGQGRIRLDDNDGIIEIIGSPTISPTPYSTTSSAASIPSSIPTSEVNAITKQYTSGVSCASVALDEKEKMYNNLLNLILGMSIISLVYFSLSKKSKV